MADKFPSVIEATAIIPKIEAHGISVNSKKVLRFSTKLINKKRQKTAIPAILGATDKNAVKDVGEPSYTSGHHIGKGTAAILYPNPAKVKIEAARTVNRMAWVEVGRPVLEDVENSAINPSFMAGISSVPNKP